MPTTVPRRFSEANSETYALSCDMAPIPSPVITRATIIVATLGLITASTMPTTTMLIDTMVSVRRP